MTVQLTQAIDVIAEERKQFGKWLENYFEPGQILYLDLKDEIEVFKQGGAPYDDLIIDEDIEIDCPECGSVLGRCVCGQKLEDLIRNE